MFSFLNTIQESRSDKFSLKARLHKHLAGPRPARPVSRVHASEVTKTDWCARRTALYILTGTPVPDEQLSTSLAVTFEIGNSLQASVVKWAVESGIAVGHWRCRRCAQKVIFCKQPKICACGGKQFDQVEVRAHSSTTGISGGLDLLVNLGKPKLTLVEIKTMAPDLFKPIVAPLAEHRLRTSLYLRAIADSEYADEIDTDEALVLYTSKGGFGVKDPSLLQLGISEGFSPFKEYWVKREDSLTDPVWESAKVLHEWRYSEGPPPPRRCETDTCALAQACPLRVYCFGTLLDASQQNLPNPG